MKELKQVMSKLQPCFGTLECFDKGENPLLCPLEPQCSNEWLRRKQESKRP